MSPRVCKGLAGRARNRRKNWDHPNYSIIEIGQNTGKGPGALRWFAVTPMKYHQLTLVWKPCNNNKQNAKYFKHVSYHFPFLLHCFSFLQRRFSFQRRCYCHNNALQKYERKSSLTWWWHQIWYRCLGFLSRHISTSYVHTQSRLSTSNVNRSYKRKLFHI